MIITIVPENPLHLSTFAYYPQRRVYSKGLSVYFKGEKGQFQEVQRILYWTDNGWTIISEEVLGIDIDTKVLSSLDEVIDNAAFTMEAYLIQKDLPYEAVIDFEWLYGKLEPGRYRIVKKRYVFHVNGYAGGMTPLLDRDGKPIIFPIGNR